MESFPPMAPTPYAICALKAPNSADTGIAQRLLSPRRLGKYSWKVR